MPENSSPLGFIISQQTLSHSSLPWQLCHTYLIRVSVLKAFLKTWGNQTNHMPVSWFFSKAVLLFIMCSQQMCTNELNPHLHASSGTSPDNTSVWKERKDPTLFPFQSSNMTHFLDLSLITPASAAVLKLWIMAMLVTGECVTELEWHSYTVPHSTTWCPY